ncbi:hypothetical protein [Frigoriglobus tundricola]|uniref:Uncharacterized protein n=1 Tax=Frigoriglobus tundricola TaxID=2774151 RepID=A0A6M5YMZ3_9BACT|nr:hypothetical protein [Frigoriglobus tundricola]QJW94730.1 hypothetical protein FTUN_2252 [Frigoriglobus tundricola]
MKDLIAKWLPLFFDADDVFEVRGLDVERPGRKMAGFVLSSRIAALASKIAAIAEKASGTYFTPHRLAADVKTRPLHHLTEVVRTGDDVRPKLTADKDVTGRRYLIIDVDPVRPAEHKKDSATDAEKAAALDVTDRVRRYLAGQGWPAPLVVDSGNGYHLYYRLADPLPGGEVPDAGADPFAGLLRALKAKFDTANAEVDPAVFNASRIMKIPGTPARKGTHTTDRPHRTSRVLEIPHDWHR